MLKFRELAGNGRNAFGELGGATWHCPQSAEGILTGRRERPGVASVPGRSGVWWEVVGEESRGFRWGSVMMRWADGDESRGVDSPSHPRVAGAPRDCPNVTPDDALRRGGCNWPRSLDQPAMIRRATMPARDRRPAARTYPGATRGSSSGDPLSRIHAVKTGDRFTRRRGGRGEWTLEWKPGRSPDGEPLPASTCSRPARLSAPSAAPLELITAWIRPSRNPESGTGGRMARCPSTD
jgi:hypothetical protein